MRNDAGDDLQGHEPEDQEQGDRQVAPVGIDTETVRVVVAMVMAVTVTMTMSMTVVIVMLVAPGVDPACDGPVHDPTIIARNVAATEVFRLTDGYRRH
jgi:hypothetical protein